MDIMKTVYIPTDEIIYQEPVSNKEEWPVMMWTRQRGQTGVMGRRGLCNTMTEEFRGQKDTRNDHTMTIPETRSCARSEWEHGWNDQCLGLMERANFVLWSLYSWISRVFRPPHAWGFWPLAVFLWAASRAVCGQVHRRHTPTHSCFFFLLIPHPAIGGCSVPKKQ